MKTDYKKIVNDLLSQISLEDYNKWLVRKDYSDDKAELYLLFSGIRIGQKLTSQQISDELQEQIPITDEEIEYYKNL